MAHASVRRGRVAPGPRLTVCVQLERDGSSLEPESSSLGVSRPQSVFNELELNALLSGPATDAKIEVRSETVTMVAPLGT